MTTVEHLNSYGPTGITNKEKKLFSFLLQMNQPITDSIMKLRLKVGSHDQIFGSLFLTGVVSAHRNIVSRQ